MRRFVLAAVATGVLAAPAAAHADTNMRVDSMFRPATTTERLVDQPVTAAAAYQNLSAGEAARLAGRALHREYPGVIARGSLNASCPATRDPAFRRCSYTYRSINSRLWCGAIGVRELAVRYVYRFLYDTRC